MSTISASTTSTTAFKVTSDTTGALVFQTGASPTTAMTLSSAQIVSFTNPPTATGGGSVATNTAYGTSALNANTTGFQNTGIGANALVLNTSGNYSVAVGFDALAANTTGANNTAVGRRALYSNTTASNNLAFGFNALFSNTTGANNTAIGADALTSSGTASNNTAVGYQAGYSGTTADRNTFVGYKAAYAITTGTRNVVVGELAGQVLTTGSYNTFVGQDAGYLTTTGSYNTFVGAQGSGEAVTTGSYNTIIGKYSGNQGGLDIRTASKSIVLSDGAGNPRGYFKDTGATYGYWHFESNDSTKNIEFDGLEFYPQPDNAVKLGFASLRWSVVYAATGTINTSDATTKQDIAELDDAEKRVAVAIKSLIKKYRFKDAVAEKGDAARIHVGAVAQEVAAAFVAEGLDPARYALFCSDTWYEVDGDAGKPSEPFTSETEGAVEVTRLGLRYEELLAFVIAAI